MQSTLANILRPIKISLRIYGIFIGDDKKALKLSIQNTRVTFILSILKSCLTVIPVLLYLFSTVVELFYLYFAIATSSSQQSSGSFDILRVLNEARFSIDRGQQLILLLVIIHHRRQISRLLEDFCRVQHCLGTNCDRGQFRRYILAPLTGMTFLAVFLFFTPECIVLEEMINTTANNSSVGNDTLTTAQSLAFDRFIATIKVPYRVIWLYGSGMLYLNYAFVIVWIVALTQLVSLHIRDGEELLRRITQTTRENSSAARCMTFLLLTFRLQRRAVADFAVTLNSVLAPLIMVMQAGNLAMLLGSVTWLFNPSLMSEPLRHWCWLSYLILRATILSYLCIRSTEMADNLLAKEKELSLAYDEHWAMRRCQQESKGNDPYSEDNSYALGKGLLDSSLMEHPAVSVGMLGNMRKETVVAEGGSICGLRVGKQIDARRPGVLILIHPESGSAIELLWDGPGFSRSVGCYLQQQSRQ
ncbi:hypothetical protein BV898_13702 [Hypsibius exemplaris]|uniref:Uncharacterized protein n=1 Tax=Hypsibius exemplaris TaxID=2072580 RepID=A0A1W0WA71_HYPEX|nr:hypothetical protein BV898_13702 [Hypsibius exemplaris]